METKLNPELNTDELENVSGGAPGGIQAGLRDALNELGIK